MKSALKLTTTRFRSPLDLDGNDTLSMITDPEEPKYFGVPAAEVEKNWEDLLGGKSILSSSSLTAGANFKAMLRVDTATDCSLALGQYFRLTQPEIDALDPFAQKQSVKQRNRVTDRFASVRGTFGELDMFHSLHCLNAIRKVVYPPPPPEPSSSSGSEGTDEHASPDYLLDEVHIDHCIEQLRQAILCHGDLTPVTMVPIFSEKTQTISLLGQTTHPHTCRDWRTLSEAVGKREMLHSKREKKKKRGFSMESETVSS